MAIFHGNSIPSAAGGYDISNSVRFNKADSPSLTRTPSSAGNRQKYTISFWMKRGDRSSGSHFYLFSTDASNSGQIYILNSTEQLGTQNHQHGTDHRTTNRSIRDTANWYHIMVAVDTTLATANHRVRMYINGEEETSFTSSANPAQNSNSDINSTTEHMIGNIHGQTRHFDGYIAEYHLVDGQQLTPSDFGESGDYGEWKPIEYSGTYGTNGCYLSFSKTSQVHNITKINSVQHSTSIKKIDASSINLTGTNAFSIADHADWSPTGDFTYEMWVYMSGSQTGWSNICSQADGTNRGFEFGPDSSGNWMARHSTKGNLTVAIPSLNTWHHMAFCRQGNTARLYLNGVQVDTDAGYSGSLNNCADVLLFGNGDTGFDQNFNGYLDEIRFSNVCRYEDGTTFTPSTSAFTDDDDTLLLIHSNAANGNTTFTDSSGANRSLGSDYSGNNNHWTLNNIAASDQTLDSPTNNFAVINHLDGRYNQGDTFSEGNLSFKCTHNGNASCKRATIPIAPNSGKYYWEVYRVDSPGENGHTLGLTGSDDSMPDSMYIGHTASDINLGIGFYGNGTTHSTGAVGGGQTVNYNATSAHAQGDIIQFAYDSSNGKIWIGKNGTWSGSGNPSTGANVWSTFSNYNRMISPAFQAHNNVHHIVNFGQDSTFAGNVSAGGNQDSNDRGNFKYPVPTGHLALCHSNLPDPAVIPREHFNATLYTGSGGAQSITGVGFSPDLTVLKRRSGVSKSWMWTDTVRGAGKYLQSDGSGAENNDIQTVNSFDADGISLGTASPQQFNDSGAPHVLYSWNAGSTVTNSQGSISAQVSANTAAGQSIMTYTGTGSNATVGHGLSKAPELVILKRRDTTSGWPIGTIQSNASMDFTDVMRLDTTQSFSDDATIWNDTAPTSSVFSLGNNIDLNASSGTYIAYCFHSVVGYSKVGMYTGGYHTDPNQPFVYLGFRPSFLMVKGITRVSPWLVIDNARDPYNFASKFMYMNDTAQDMTSHPGGASKWDFLSNGFKIRHANGDGDVNTSNAKYLYIAFAEQPFKYTNAQ